ncbi:hypothetical protein J6590_025182 [Homalodisca vitripennis]|nr:hypothetical protein J6590_025182 [Homalodisca vitripennis]
MVTEDKMIESGLTSCTWIYRTREPDKFASVAAAGRPRSATGLRQRRCQEILPVDESLVVAFVGDYMTKKALPVKSAVRVQSRGAIRRSRSVLLMDRSTEGVVTAGYQ